MSEDLIIKSLSPSDLDQMVTAFNQAFENYFVPLHFTKEQFVARFIERLQLDFELSAGTYYQGRLVAFIFTSTGIYKEKRTAYNGGTGVVPEFRGRGLTQKMYAYLIPHFKRRSIKFCVLEVITENHKAISAYEAVGFKKSEFLQCFKLSNPPEDVFGDVVSQKIEILKDPDWELLESFTDTSPSFLDSFDVLPLIIKKEKVILYKENSKKIAYAIFDSEKGRIFQLGVKENFRRKGIGSELIKYIYKNSTVKELTIMNIRDQNSGLISFLKKLGFENQINQYEMGLTL